MDFPPNSHKAKDQEPPAKKVEKVITGEVVQKPKPLGRRFKDVFFGGDFRNVARYITGEVLLPAIRNMIVDTSTEGIRRAVYGESSARRRTGTAPASYNPRVSYNTPISRLGRDPRETSYLPDQPPYSPLSVRRDVDNMVLSSREDAEMVLEQLNNILDTYDFVAVADLYDLVGLSAAHTDHRRGWTALPNVVIRQIREGYLLELPPTQDLV